MKLAMLLVLAIILGLIAGAGYLWLQQQDLPIENLVLTSDCKPSNQACVVANVAGQSMEFRLAPQPIPVMEPVQVYVAIDGISEVDAVKVVVDGVNMFMGYQYAELAEHDQQWQGSFILPLCTQALMQWQAEVDVYTPSRRYRGVFPFQTLGSNQARQIESW